MNPTPAQTVVHKHAESRFEVATDAGSAVLEYLLLGNRMVITHTFVPAELRGRGIAERLMKAAVAAAHAGHLTIEPQCSYAARYLERHGQGSA